MAVFGLRANQAMRDLIGRIHGARDAVLRVLARIDPNDDPGADRLTPLPLLALAAALGVSAWMFLRWKYQPMQDLGLHVSLAAIVADYGRPHSLYTSLYGPIDHFAANSLMAQVAGYLGRIIGVTTAVRGCILFYVVGFPLTTLYALRSFGRSAWGAVLAVPVSYNFVYIAGFASMMFAAPLALLSIVFFYSAMQSSTRGHPLGVAVTLTLLFLAHAHLFLWTGLILFLTALGFVIQDLSRSDAPLRVRARAVGVRVVVAIVAIVPSMVLFVNWFWRTFENQQERGHPEGATSGWHDHFGAVFKGVHAMMDLLSAAFGLYGRGDDEFTDLMWLFAAVAVCVAVSRMHRYRHAPVFELACGLTAISFFVLPDGLKGHDVIAPRQLPIALWFLPALASPVPAHVSRLGRWVAVALILVFTARTLRTWHEHLVEFESKEVAGLEWVMASAPPRQRIHYVKLDIESHYFAGRPFAHVEKVYMGDRFGSSSDTPGILTTSFVRFKEGVDIHRVLYHGPEWPDDPEIWQNFDLILTRGWAPSADLRAAAEEHGELLRKMGDWELWRSKLATPLKEAP